MFFVSVCNIFLIYYKKLTIIEIFLTGDFLDKIKYKTKHAVPFSSANFIKYNLEKQK